MLVVGHLTEDAAPGGGRLGGAVAYAGLLAQRSGLPTTILTATDPGFPFFRLLRGIRVVRAAGEGRTRFENRYAPDGSRRQRLLGRAPPIPHRTVVREVAALPPGSAVLYAPVVDELRGTAPLPRPPRLSLWRATGSRRIGTPTTRAGAIAQGFCRRWDQAGRVSTHWPAGVRERLSRLDLVSLSEEEVPPGADLPVPLLAVTRGKRGAVIRRPGAPDVTVEAFPARAVDPTGAGDVFGAALFLSLWLGQPLARAGRTAAWAAARCVQGVGTAAVPDLRKAPLQSP